MSSPKLAEISEAYAMYSRSLRREGADAESTKQLLVAYIGSLNIYSTDLITRGSPNESMDILSQFESQFPQPTSFPTHDEYVQWHTTTLSNMACAARTLGHRRDAVELLEHALQIHALVSEHDGATTRVNICVILSELGYHDRAAAHAARAVEALRRAPPAGPEGERDLAIALYNLGVERLFLGHVTAARRAFRAALGLVDALPAGQAAFRKQIVAKISEAQKASAPAAPLRPRTASQARSGAQVRGRARRSTTSMAARRPLTARRPSTAHAAAPPRPVSSGVHRPAPPRRRRPPSSAGAARRRYELRRSQSQAAASAASFAPARMARALERNRAHGQDRRDLEAEAKITESLRTRSFASRSVHGAHESPVAAVSPQTLIRGLPEVEPSSEEGPGSPSEGPLGQSGFDEAPSPPMLASAEAPTPRPLGSPSPRSEAPTASSTPKQQGSPASSPAPREPTTPAIDEALDAAASNHVTTDEPSKGEAEPSARAGSAASRSTVSEGTGVNEESNATSPSAPVLEGAFEGAVPSTAHSSSGRSAPASEEEEKPEALRPTRPPQPGVPETLPPPPPTPRAPSEESTSPDPAPPYFVATPLRGDFSKVSHAPPQVGRDHPPPIGRSEHYSSPSVEGSSPELPRSPSSPHVTPREHPEQASHAPIMRPRRPALARVTAFDLGSFFGIPAQHELVRRAARLLRGTTDPSAASHTRRG